MYAFPAKLFGQNLAAVFVISSKMLSCWCVVIEVQIYQVNSPCYYSNNINSENNHVSLGLAQ